MELWITDCKPYNKIGPEDYVHLVVNGEENLGFWDETSDGNLIRLKPVWSDNKVSTDKQKYMKYLKEFLKE